MSEKRKIKITVDDDRNDLQGESGEFLAEERAQAANGAFFDGDDSEGEEDTNYSEDEEALEGYDEDLRDVNLESLDGSSEKVQAELSRYKAEAQENREKYLRALADFENYKKRVIRERSELLKYQGERAFRDILEVMDNLELALSHRETGDVDKFREGVTLIHKLFIDVLHRWDVRGESGIGEIFDPTKHNAISRVPDPEAPAGTIVNELKKAYYYKDKLLRPAEVVVAEGVPEARSDEHEEELEGEEG